MLAQIVKQLDPAHRPFTAVAGLSPDKATGLNEHTPSLDFVRSNTYAALPSLLQHRHVKDTGWIYHTSTVRFGQSPVPVIRLRLTAVDGWMFGRINVVPYDDDIPNIGLVQ